MSTRVLKKLYGDGDDLKPGSTAVTDNRLSDTDSDSLSNDNTKPSKSQKNKKLAINRFELLNNLEQQSMSDTEAKEDDDKDNDSVLNWVPEKSKLEKQDSTQSTDSLKKKRKKKKKIRSQKSMEGQLDDIDATVEEVNKLLANSRLTIDTNLKSNDCQKVHKKSVLIVEQRHLNPENEMKRIFGSKVIQAEQLALQRRRGRHRHSISRNWILVNPKNWQNIGKCGISMEYVEKVEDVLHFNIIHNKMYQSVQFQFLDAVESYNPDNLVAILNTHPYHIDTLIQFSDVCKMAEDNQMAAELIERALYCMEHIFHPLFNVSQANCRLDYRRSENRGFYIALFKHLTFVGQRGCNRTALEFCKLILGLDPEGDPLSVLLMIDFYAIRCEQFEYLLNLYEEWEPIKKLSLLPNFRFSCALALHYMSTKSPDLTHKADHCLQDALIMFPELLLQLLDKCSVEPDQEVSKCDYFRTSAQNTTQAISQLIALYVGRNHLLWKDRDVMSWLESNTRQVIKRISNNDPFIKTCAERRKKYLSGGTPMNVLRHVLLSGIKEATLALPKDLTKNAIFGFDPLPPVDSIVSYNRPQKPAVTSEGTDQDRSGLLSVFLRSWLPDFNAEELVRGGPPGRAGGPPIGELLRNLDNEPDGPEAGGAVGGRHPANTNDLRRSVTSLLDAMRDLLSNIHMADVPNEGDISSEDREDDEPQQQH